MRGPQSPDPLDRAFPQGKPRVSSPWLDAEARNFTELLKAGKYDLMVGPVRTEGYALDRISRSLILAEVTKELAARKLRVPNPVALSRAMGESRRRFERGEYLTMARSLGIQKVVVVGVAHDRRGHVNASVGVLDARSLGSQLNSRPLAEISLVATAHPSIVGEAIAPAVLEALGLAGKAPARPKSASAARKPRFPASPAQALAIKPADATGRASALQLIASLAPMWPGRPRERLFEQALLAARALPPGQPYAALFIARAWYHLDARVSALAALADSGAPEALAYREFLNGNLPEFQKALVAVKDELPRLLLEIDLKTLQTAYRRLEARESTPFFDAFADRYPEWAPLVGRALQDLDFFTTKADLALPKRMLDRDFGLPGENLDDQMAGMRLTGQVTDEVALVKLALHHIARARREHRAGATCFTTSEPCLAGAYLDLLEAIAVSNAIQELQRLVEMQALPARARQLASALKPELEGHPAILALEAAAELGIANQMPASQREAAHAEVVRLAQAAALLEQGQSLTSWKALVQLGVPSPYSAPFVKAYRFDLPVRFYWFAGPDYGDAGEPVDLVEYLDLLHRQLAASAMNLSAAKFLLEYEEGKSELRTLLDARFKGSPDRAQFAEALGTSPEERRQLSDAQLRERPDRWDYYAERGKRLMDEKGDYKAAADAYAKYPGFIDPSRYEPVELSNQAYAVGSGFFWQGRPEEARRFYDIASKLNTGSAASLASAQRLAQLDKRYAAVLEAARDRGQRYHDPYAWRDFLSWLFVLGLGDQAWQGFNQLQGGFDNPQVWLAADVGLRMKGGDWESQKRWLLTEPYKSSQAMGTVRGMRLALMLAVIDRAPPQDLVSTLRELAGPPNTRVEKFVVERTPARGSQTIGYPRSAFRANDRPAVREGTLVDSEFVLFAEAYVDLRRGRFKAAVERFDRMAQFYPIEGAPMHGFPAFALPYFAWASAKVGDPLSLEAFVRGAPGSLPRGFDHALALAFFAGLRGEHEAAENDLKFAFRHRPFTDMRPIFTEYQWAEACEWLYAATGRKEYLDLALDWAHRYQRVMPVSAWAYAFEAKYATDEQQRLRATGIAQYLDPRSERLAAVPAGFRKRASQWFDANNPFKAPGREKGDQARARQGPRNTLLQTSARAS